MATSGRERSFVCLFACVETRKKRQDVTNQQIKAPVTSNGSQSQLLFAADFQHSDTNNVLKNASPITESFSSLLVLQNCHTVSNSIVNYSTDESIFFLLLAATLFCHLAFSS